MAVSQEFVEKFERICLWSFSKASVHFLVHVSHKKVTLTALLNQEFLGSVEGTKEMAASAFLALSGSAG